MDWGALDLLLVDTPPGTTDEHLSIVQVHFMKLDLGDFRIIPQYLAGAHLRGAIVVTTPQEVALQDVRKEITFCNRVGLKVMGLVENMSTFVCPTCNKGSTILPSTTGGATSLAQELALPLLAKYRVSENERV